jgi:hypothetical protein
MKWKRACSSLPQVCSVRGCPIPAGTPYWIKHWRRQRKAVWVDSIYCQRCGHTSRCRPGVVTVGPCILAGLFILSFVALPLAWPGHWALYPFVFLLTVWLTILFSRRIFFRLFRNSPQLCDAREDATVQQKSE